MSTPQSKRRRLNEATKTLHKPFKSHFRTPIGQKQPNLGSDLPSSNPSETGTYPRHALAHKSAVNGHSADQPTPNSSTLALVARASPPSAAHPRYLQKKTTPPKLSLARETIELRNDLNVLSQALTLATTTKDDDLIMLIERWRRASRAAAEELFATTRDRVNRMGGVGAWKDREREQKEWKLNAEREELEVERLRLQEAMIEAREKGELSEEAYERCSNTETETDTQRGETEETCPTIEDDVSQQRLHHTILWALIFLSHLRWT